jgi:hypothetical protein
MLTAWVRCAHDVAVMKKRATKRRVQAPDLMGDRLVGRCDSAFKAEVALALAVTGLDESKLVRLSIEHVLPALFAGAMVYQNGKLVAVERPATSLLLSGPAPSGTEG